MSYVIMKIGLSVLNKYIRQNAVLTKLLFGVKINSNKRIHWDFTTLLLKKCLNNYINKDSKVLEIGAGPYAILSIYFMKKFNCQVEACDINWEYVENSSLNARDNNVKFNIYQSDLFENVKNKFDQIFFNSVYISEKTGLELGINRFHDYQTDWCGGADGLQTIERFLSGCGPHLNGGGKVFLGFNPHYLKFEEIKNIYREYGLKMIGTFKKNCNPSRILIFSKT